GGINAAAEGALPQGDTLMRALQTTVERYEGSINKLLVDDKGTIGVILFGAPPLAHEDGALGGVRCALVLQRSQREQRVERVRRRPRGGFLAGRVGSATRREYTVIGDPVNLAARLMQAAGPGRILADHATSHATRADLAWQILPPQLVKGKAAAVRAYLPLGERRDQSAATVAQLIGRSDEVAHLDTALAALRSRTAGLLCIEGEPGIGKSRMVAELVQRARAHGVVDLAGSGLSHEQQTAYRGWQPIFSSYFDLDSAPAAGAAAQVEARLAEFAPALLERAPLLNDVLGLNLAENDLTRSLEPRLRQASLTALLIDLLALWAAERPLLLVLEDAQWLDSLSWEVALQLARAMAGMPLLLVLVVRSPGELGVEHPYWAVRRLASHPALTLGPLPAADAAVLAAARLGVARITNDFAELIWQRTSGSPFVVEELVLSLRDSAAIAIDGNTARLVADPQQLQLPDTVQGLVLSRIDRLAAEAQLTIKIAAVVGQIFGAAVLREVAPDRQVRQHLVANLAELGRADMIQVLDEATPLRSHQFRQSIIHEVTYRTLLHAQREELHRRVAGWYEVRDDEHGDLSPLLAFHWRQAGDTERELRFAARAARRLAAEYANNEALGYLSRALELVHDPAERYALHWLRMQVYERIGDRAGQRTDLAILETLAAHEQQNDHMAQVANAWAALYRDISDYPAALAAIERARAIASSAGDRTSEARSLTLRGQVMEYQGNYQ
ncbi:MAG TPA: AAA family ATPase, partial [Roseiflexaceae bacterium]|nr:AAA family ATPase [Roseiflexaceae bacterium]